MNTGFNEASPIVESFLPTHDWATSTNPASGLASVVGMLKKRLEVAVDEVIKQKLAAQEQVEQNALEFAIESSNLEAKISAYKEEAENKSVEIEKLKELVLSQDKKAENLTAELVKQRSLFEGIEGKLSLEEEKLSRAESIISQQKDRAS